VNILALPPELSNGLFPSKVAVHLADMSSLTDEQLLSLLWEIDVVVFAAGVDDRVTPKNCSPLFLQT